ncbi:DUF4190 domain-containing protein [Demequina sp. SO4-13]|uniref:DUF4190 domain-containing protein n=1 Tax=Demequina sp. SO4-13 TaxID=3401027 RepID=UPI003AF659A1
MPDGDARDDHSAEGSVGGPSPTVKPPHPASTAPSPASAASPAPASAAPAGEGPAAGEEPAPTARTAEDGETQVMEPVKDEPTQVMDPVPGEEPVPRRAPWAPTPPEAQGEHAADRPVSTDAPAGPPSTDRNWLGVVAFVTGALFLSLVAIVLGHLGLSAAKRGRANNRTFAMAGLILGYMGLAATAAGAWLLFASGPTPAEVDVQAQQDVSAVGAAVAMLAVETDRVLEVAETADGYTVGGQAIPAEITTPHELAIVGDGPADWCLEIVYEGGEQGAFSYAATEGMSPGRC